MAREHLGSAVSKVKDRQGRRRVTGNKKMQAEGKLDKAKGTVQTLLAM